MTAGPSGRLGRPLAGPAAVGLALVMAAVSACGSQPRHPDTEAAATAHRDAASAAKTCLASAKPAAGRYPDAFPSAWPWPPHTVVTSIEDRGREGVVVSASSSIPFSQVLNFLNVEPAHAGFAVTSGETEEHDAEANWSGGAYRGRWAIRESATCAGVTSIQVLATDR